MACALFEPLKEDSSFRWEEPLLEGYGSGKGKGKMVNFHTDVHQSMKGKTFLCTADGNCDEAFDSIELLMGHMRVHHRPTRFFRCEKCEQKFNTNRSLFKHLHVCLNHDEPGLAFGRRSTRATPGTTAAPPASIMATLPVVVTAPDTDMAAPDSGIAASPPGGTGGPLDTTNATAVAADVTTTCLATDATTAVGVAAAPCSVTAALSSDVTLAGACVAPPDAVLKERKATDEMPELTCERVGAPRSLPPPSPAPPLEVPSGLPMPKLKSSQEQEMPHLKPGPSVAPNVGLKRKRRNGRGSSLVDAPKTEDRVTGLLQQEASAAPTLKRVLASEDATESSKGLAPAVSDGSIEDISVAQHLAPPRLSRSSNECGEDGTLASTSLFKRKNKKGGRSRGESTVTRVCEVALPALLRGGEESSDNVLIAVVSKGGIKKGTERSGDSSLSAGVQRLDSCRPSLREEESETCMGTQSGAPKGKNKASAGHLDPTSTARVSELDGSSHYGTAQAGPPKRRRKAVGRGRNTRRKVAAAATAVSGKASSKTLLLKLRTARAVGDETQWIREDARGDCSPCSAPASPPPEQGDTVRDDGSDRGCSAASTSGNTGAGGTESPVADCDDRTPPTPTSSPPPPPPPVRGRKGKAVAPVMGGSGGSSESHAGADAAAAAPAVASEQDDTPLMPRVASLLPPAHHSHPGWQAGSARWKAAGLSGKRRVSWQHTRGLYTCTNCSFSSLCRQEATRHVYEHSR